MAETFNRKENSGLVRILLLVLAVLVLLIVLLTVYAFVSGAVSVENPETGAGLSLQTDESLKDKVYTGIGTLRVLTAGNKPSLVIINPVFYYDSGDLEFFEELQRKRARLEQIVRDWVSSNTASYFLETSDEKLRSDLAGLLSEILILGSVENLYFNEFLVVDGNL